MVFPIVEIEKTVIYHGFWDGGMVCYDWHWG